MSQTAADLAHMACHGRLRADNPAFSSLQLHDGLLTLHEMEIRRIAPHRMVLAACDSAVDTAYEGNELLGFVSALMARGTCGLVASIVVVPRERWCAPTAATSAGSPEVTVWLPPP